EDGQVFGDLGGELFHLFVDLLPLQAGQAGEAQLQDGAGLRFGELDAALLHLVARIVDQLQQRQDISGVPTAFHQLFAGDVGVGRGFNDGDHLVDIGNGDGQPDQYMGAVAGLAEQEGGAAGDDFLAEGDESADDVLNVHQLGAAVIERQHVDAEAGL